MSWEEVLTHVASAYISPANILDVTICLGQKVGHSREDKENIIASIKYSLIYSFIPSFIHSSNVDCAKL